MATYRHERTECQRVDESLTAGFSGWMLACLAKRSVRQGSSAATEYWEKGELLGPGDDRICGVTFECDLPAMIEIARCWI